MVRHGALKLKAQIFCGDQPAIGPGKADLLEAIDREGSISAAGRAMGDELSPNLDASRQHESILEG